MRMSGFACLVQIFVSCWILTNVCLFAEEATIVCGQLQPVVEPGAPRATEGNAKNGRVCLNRVCLCLKLLELCVCE